MATSSHRDRHCLLDGILEAAIEPKGSTQMNARILVLAAAALMFAAPAFGCSSGRPSDRPCQGIAEAEREAGEEEHQVECLHPQVRPQQERRLRLQGRLISRPSASRAPPRACGMSEASRSATSPPALKAPTGHAWNQSPLLPSAPARLKIFFARRFGDRATQLDCTAWSRCHRPSRRCAGGEA